MRRVSGRLFAPPLLSALLGSGSSRSYNGNNNNGPFSGGTFYGTVNAATGENSRAYNGGVHYEASGNGSAAGPNSGAFSGRNYGGANVSGTGNTVHVDNSANTHQYWTHIDPNYVGYGLVFLTMIWMYAAWGEAWQDCNKFKTTLNSLQAEEEKLRAEIELLKRQEEVKTTTKKYRHERDRAAEEVNVRKEKLKSSLEVLAGEMNRLPSKLEEAIRFSKRNNLERLRKKLAELGLYQSPKITQHTISQRVKVFFSKNKEEILLFAVILFYCFYSTDKLAEQFRMRLSQLFACLCSLLQRQPSGNDNSHVSRSRQGNGSVSPGAPPTRVPHRDDDSRVDTIPRRFPLRAPENSDNTPGDAEQAMPETTVRQEA